MALAVQFFDFGDFHYTNKHYFGINRGNMRIPNIRRTVQPSKWVWIGSGKYVDTFNITTYLLTMFVE